MEKFGERNQGGEILEMKLGWRNFEEVILVEKLSGSMSTACRYSPDFFIASTQLNFSEELLK